MLISHVDRRTTVSAWCPLQGTVSPNPRSPTAFHRFASSCGSSSPAEPRMEAGTRRSEQTHMERCGRPPLLLLLLLLLGLLLPLCSAGADERFSSDRHAVYWNSSNPRFFRGDYTVEVSINDYLDIYCPHYEEAEPTVVMENYVLYMVNYDGYTSCSHRRRGFKRWECNRPQNAAGALRFSEKFQLFTPFSLGFEFRPAHEYYYISSPHPNLAGKACLKLKIYVRPSNDSLYESPEPYLTEDASGCGSLSWPRLPLLATMLMLILLP